MPYIPQEDRPKIDYHIEAIVRTICDIAKEKNYEGIISGYLTYVCLRLVLQTIKRYYITIRYHILVTICGIFTVLPMEIWRRLGKYYEDTKILGNGDIPELEEFLAPIKKELNGLQPKKKIYRKQGVKILTKK